MTQTIVLAPTKAAAQSTDFTNTGSAVSLAIYSPDTDSRAYLGQLTLFRKIGTAYYPVCDEAGSIVYLGDQRREVAISAPGTYAVVKEASAWNVGASVDS